MLASLVFNMGCSIWVLSFKIIVSSFIFWGLEKIIYYSRKKEYHVCVIYWNSNSKNLHFCSEDLLFGSICIGRFFFKAGSFMKWILIWILTVVLSCFLLYIYNFFFFPLEICVVGFLFFVSTFLHFIFLLKFCPFHM